MFETLNQCVLAFAASFLGIAEVPGVEVESHILSWQRVGGIYSSLDEPSAPWSSLLVNAIATQCDAERTHNWEWWCVDQGVTYATNANDWLSNTLLPNSTQLSPYDVTPGDLVVWNVGGVARVGVFADKLSYTTYLIVAGDQSDAVRLVPVSVNAIVGARRLAPAPLVCDLE